MATKLKFTQTLKQTLEVAVPDYYPSDDTPIGKAVDFLLKNHLCRGRTVRERLFDDDGDTVQRAISQLDDAYDQVREIAEILGVKS